MSDILNEMETMETKEPEQKEETKEFNIESFDLFSEEAKPKVNEKNSEIIDKRLSSRFAELEKREKALNDRIAKFEERFKEMEDSDKGNDYSSLAKLKAIAEENPRKAAEMIGLTYEKFTDQILKENDPDAEKYNKIKYEALTEADKKYMTREEYEAEKKKELDNREEIEYNKYVENLTDKLSKNDELVYINAMNAHQRVVNAIEQYVNKHGIGENNIRNESLEDIELKASRAVEKDLKREYEALQEKLGNKSHISDTTLTNQDRVNAPFKRKSVDEMSKSELHKEAVRLIQEGFETDNE